jgi:protein O-mannosyl-transferase
MTGAGRSRGLWQARLWFAAICAVTLLAYLRSFSVPFQFDDFSQVVGNKVLKAPTFDAFFHFAHSRVLPFGSLVLNYRIGGEEPFGYHVFNFAIHLLTTLAVFGLVASLCRTPRIRETPLAIHRLALAVAAAFVFACHPIQIQAVTYVAQRMASMVTLFYVGSVLLYVRARNAQLGVQAGRPALLYAGAALLALGAFLSKENSASLPLAILLAELTFYPSRGPARRFLRLVPFLALVLVIPLSWYLFGKFTREAPGAEASLLDRLRYLVDLVSVRAYPRRQSSALQYFLTQCVVIPRYLRLVVLPWGFNVDHDVPIVQGLSTPVVAGFTFLTALLAFGLYSLRRWPLVGFGTVWLFIALSVESSFLPIQDAMVEHRMYLAMPGVALVAAVAFVWVLRRRRAAALIAGAVAAGLLCGLTFARNEVWLTPLALWQDALGKSPQKARVYLNVGYALHREKRIEEAIPFYCKALAIDPRNLQAQINLNAAVEERLDAKAEAGEVTLDALEMGPDGTLTLTPPDPCAPPSRDK